MICRAEIFVKVRGVQSNTFRTLVVQREDNVLTEPEAKIREVGD